MLQCDSLYDRHVSDPFLRGHWWLKRPQNSLPANSKGDIADIAELENQFAVQTRRDIFVAFCVHGH